VAVVGERRKKNSTRKKRTSRGKRSFVGVLGGWGDPHLVPKRMDDPELHKRTDESESKNLKKRVSMKRLQRAAL